MFRKMFRFFCAILRLLKSLFFTLTREKMIDCIHSNINRLVIISSCGSKRRMRFENFSSGCQAEIDLNQIHCPSEEYIQLMIISCIYSSFKQQEKEILIFGLGGGILPRAIRHLYSNYSITIVEIDQAVCQMAKKYFHFQEDSKMNVIIQDGKDFLENLSPEMIYDLIYVDMYDLNSSIPENIKTKEYFLSLKNHLNPKDGLLVLNLVCIYKSFYFIQQLIYSIFTNYFFLTFRTKNYLNIVLLISTVSFENIEFSNEQIHFIQLLKDKLSIDFYSLFQTKEKTKFHHNQFIQHYSNKPEQNMSLREFYNVL